MQNETNDVGHDLRIAKVTRRASGSGAWVTGSMSGHQFEALVFPEHADNAEWEISDSRISKLWIRRMSDRQTTYNWDRGLGIAATDATTQAIVSFICAGLAEHVYGR